MEKNRLEAFSDGVIAIIITIMILELKIPHASDMDALRQMLPGFLSYVLSFVYIAIYWNNHHHMLSTVRIINGRILWANIHLLFWLSLVPTATAWMGENHYAPIPTAVYGLLLLLSAIAYTLLQTIIIQSGPSHSSLARAVGSDRKGKLSILLYALGVSLAFVDTLYSDVLYVTVALIWLLPDPRIEKLTAGKA
jgi:uncharacterized membrane protein